MKELYDKFIFLDAEAKKKTHIKACSYSLAAWDAFVQKGKQLTYRDSVVSMDHRVKETLPRRALQAIVDSMPSKEISDEYLEPISALQDMDWKLPEHIECAYYSIYNLYRKYGEKADVDDWLIVNQCLSSETNEKNWDIIFESII